MDKQTYTIDENTVIQVKTHGNLAVQGWENADLGVQASRNELRVYHEGNVLRIVALSNCELWVPAGRAVNIDKVGGNAGVIDFDGQMVLDRVGGDLILQNAGVVTTSRVGGKLVARKLVSLTVDKVGGRCVVEDITGDFKVDRIGGDFRGKGISGAVVSRVGGDVELHAQTLSGSMKAGGNIHARLATFMVPEISLRAGGNLKLHLPADQQINLDITSDEEYIRIELGELDMNIQEETYRLHMGEGLPKLRLDAGGRVAISSDDWTPGEFGDAFEHHFEFNWDLDMDKTMRKVEKAVEKSARMAEHGARIGEEMARRAEARVAEVMRSMDMGDPSGFTNWPQPPVPPEPPAAPQHSTVSEEERMAVLRMLQEKKITLEEAERLLDALETYSE